MSRPLGAGEERSGGGKGGRESLRRADDGLEAETVLARELSDVHFNSLQRSKMHVGWTKVQRDQDWGSHSSSHSSCRGLETGAVVGWRQELPQMGWRYGEPPNRRNQKIKTLSLKLNC